jgi:hypothetical protein
MCRGATIPRGHRSVAVAVSQSQCVDATLECCRVRRAHYCQISNEISNCRREVYFQGNTDVSPAACWWHRTTGGGGQFDQSTFRCCARACCVQPLSNHSPSLQLGCQHSSGCMKPSGQGCGPEAARGHDTWGRAQHLSGFHQCRAGPAAAAAAQRATTRCIP